MNAAPSPFSEPELAAVGLTMAPARRDASPLRDRLAAASALLNSLAVQPTEASLVFCRGADAPAEAAPIGGGVTVGRGKDAALCLENCTELSRNHFRMRPESGVWLLEDAGSRNGTRVDGVDGPITRRVLRDGDIIFAGELIFLFVNPAD